MSLGVTVHDPNAVPASEKIVEITPAAIAHIRKDLQKHNAKGLRLGVKKAGCSGLKYVVDYVYEVNDHDHKFTFDHDLQVFIDPDSLRPLLGITVDYVKEGLNGRLKFINPNEKGSCGCGESFMV